MNLNAIPQDELQHAVRLARNFLCGRRRVLPEDADDIIQNALVSALKTDKAFEGRSRFSTWFLRVVTNAWLIKLRSESCSTRNYSANVPIDAALEHSAKEPTPERLYLDKEQDAIVRRCLHTLGPVHRDTFSMYIDGWSTRELADMEGTSLCTIKARIWRVRQHVRQMLREAA